MLLVNVTAIAHPEMVMGCASVPGVLSLQGTEFEEASSDRHKCLGLGVNRLISALLLLIYPWRDASYLASECLYSHIGSIKILLTFISVSGNRLAHWTLMFP